jgi:hypothetical protein
MSVYRGWKNGGNYGSNLSSPVAINLNFIVDSTNGNGLGIRSLKSNGWVRNVFMNTSASITGTVATTANAITSISQGTSALVPGMPVQGTGIPAGTTITSITSSSAVGISATPTGNHSSESITYQGFNNSYANPNPAAGYVLVQFKQNFNIYLGGFSGFVSPPTGNASSTTAGNAYIIRSLGTTTLAQWNAAGLPPGLTPTVNQSFIATATGSIGGTGTVYTPSVSGITSLEAIGDPNQSISNSSIAQYGGAWLLFQALGPTISTGAYVSPFIPTAPANNSVIGMTVFMDSSSADPIMLTGDALNS